MNKFGLAKLSLNTIKAVNLMGANYVNGKPMKRNSVNLLDQYFTKPSIAQELFKITSKIIKKYEGAGFDEFTWLEPSVGEGCFFDLLPVSRRVGIDIEPRRKGIIKSNYLSYELPDKKLIVIGNPPFGHRGVIALDFINHSAKADYVCFILPMFFDSLGKGSARYRVKGFNLIHSQKIQNNAFYTHNGIDVDVKCVFQIWSKNHKSSLQELNWYALKDKNPFKKFFDVYTVSLAKNRECGKEWIFNKKADYYISSTFYSQNKVVKTFGEVKYKSGIAIVFNTKNKKLIKTMSSVLENADWTCYGSLATNSCYHIGKSHIYKLMFNNLQGIIK